MMKNKILVAIIVISLLIFTTCVGIYHFFFSMNSLPHGRFFCESISPQGTYTVNAYVISSSLSSVAVRCEVVNNLTKKTRNIYWGYREMFDSIEWESDEVVIINGRILNVKKDSYDFRRK